MDDKTMEQLLSGMESKVLDDAARAGLEGSFIKLSDGYTHYQLHVGDNGKAVVLVHGFITPYFLYDKYFDALVAEGYTVLRYDLIGRGFSDRPNTGYGPQVFVKQLRELTTALLGETPFALVGTSMGGIITSTFAAQYPQAVTKLLLLAPAGFRYNAPFYMKLCKVKGLGSWIFHNVAGKLQLKRCDAELLTQPQAVKDEYVARFARAMQYKGILTASHSSLVNTILNFDESEQGYRKLGSAGTLPVLAIWGTKDATMPYYLSKSLLEAVPQAHLITLEGSGHIFVYDEAERSLPEALAFLSE